jgi:hypothetical protein
LLPIYPWKNVNVSSIQSFKSILVTLKKNQKLNSEVNILYPGRLSDRVEIFIEIGKSGLKYHLTQNQIRWLKIESYVENFTKDETSKDYFQYFVPYTEMRYAIENVPISKEVSESDEEDKDEVKLHYINLNIEHNVRKPPVELDANLILSETVLLELEAYLTQSERIVSAKGTPVIEEITPKESKRSKTEYAKDLFWTIFGRRKHKGEFTPAKKTK